MATPYQNLIRNVKRLPFYLQGISNIDIKVDDLIIKNKIGYSRKETSNEYDDYAVDGRYQTGRSKQTYTRIESPYFVADYKIRREKFYRMASLPEIERILHVISDEAIIYDDRNMFCKLKTQGDLKPEVAKWIEKAFAKIYSMWGFDDGQTAWEFFLKFMIEGFGAYEIIYDDKDDPKEVVGFEEMDAMTLAPSLRKNEDGELVKIWVQRAANGFGSTGNQSMIDRILPDESVIFIAYNRVGGNFGRLSYIERLERSFNIMRIMEDTKAGWMIMNSQFRMKIVVPVNDKSTTKAKQTLAKVNAKYKEDLFIDEENGEFKMNGASRINFGKLFIFPNRGGVEPTVEGVKFDGPDMQDMGPAEYFTKRFNRDTNLPYSRFDREGGGGANMLFEASGVPFDEITYYRWINRMRREYAQMLIKPLYNQILMKYPQFKQDRSFKQKLIVEFESNFLMQKARQFEEEKRAIDKINELSSMVKPNGKPIFATQFLLHKYWPWSKEEMAINNRILKLELNDAEVSDTDFEAPPAPTGDEFGLDEPDDIVPDDADGQEEITEPEEEPEEELAPEG